MRKGTMKRSRLSKHERRAILSFWTDSYESSSLLACEHLLLVLKVLLVALSLDFATSDTLFVWWKSDDFCRKDGLMPLAFLIH